MLDTTLLTALQNKNLYSHNVNQFQVIETHLSWVLLTGLYAYKIKKPLNLGFQDFSTLEKRRYYCELELTLNKRLAKEIYLEVLPITGTPSQPHFGEGDPIEYAIKMHQFSQDGLLSLLAKKQQLTKSIIEEIANQIATFHQFAPISTPASEFGLPLPTFAPIDENFQVLKTISSNHFAQISRIQQWSNSQFHQLKTLLTQRKMQGFIRACHGDLHLGNIVMYNNKPLIFDCIEFNESFRWIDVMNDIGFLTMDLLHENASGFSNLLLNKYLEKTYDYHGIPLLRFYESYRAMVRAKVLSLQRNQLLTPLQGSLLESQMEGFLKVAESLIEPLMPQLTLTFGVSGSGKTIYTEQFIMDSGAIRLRSDISRKHLHDISLHQTAEHLYSIDATKAVYQELKNLAKMLIEANYSVVIDATCLKSWQRAQFFELGESLGVPVNILSFTATIAILRDRINQRLRKGMDVSDADENVLAMQLQQIDPLSEKEKQCTTFISIDEINQLMNQ